MSSSKDHDGYLAKLQQIQDADAARLDALRQADEDRRALFEEVLTKYKDLIELHGDLASDLSDLKLVNRTLNSSIRGLSAELDSLKQQEDSKSLVGVFIDGDGAKFHEHLVRDGLEGGELAAQNLKDAIKKQLKDLYPNDNTGNWQIIVWYITALDGLASVYHGALSQNMEYHGVSFRDCLRLFAIGINRGADYNFNFIDVGGGNNDLKLKEITDAKLRETFKIMLPHCRHVFFAGCHDEGYVTFLSPYKHDQKIAPKITLIESHNTRPKFHELGFRMTKFPGIFRTEDFSHPTKLHPPAISTAVLQDRNRANGVASPPQLLESRAPTPVMSPSGAGSWASSARNGMTSSSKVIDIKPAKRASDVKKFYLVNAQNERVDGPLPKAPPQAHESLLNRIERENGGRNFCNQCNFFDPETCSTQADFKHGKADLTPGEELVLRQKVRGILCPQGSWCEVFDCPFGHHCRYGSNCNNPGACKFATTHHKPSRKIFEDGSYKLL
ncbi:C-x8-C-x5-C-x3-H type zinc finger protein [Diaporthe helianthi]|uniref:C-x8-C-x5-C-x3-H type zinc finger protein n=1 Tax=Diaporthe helianthi TaxID=158607 RepID=A0A2P5HG26_DIAHE|nr:C-x8-C-x5-C-x3-H type zinc finger protein [Diaporthe helianthi]